MNCLVFLLTGKDAYLRSLRQILLGKLSSDQAWDVLSAWRVANLSTFFVHPSVQVFGALSATTTLRVATTGYADTFG